MPKQELTVADEVRSANSDEIAYGTEAEEDAGADLIDSAAPKGKKRPTRAIVFEKDSDSEEEVKRETFN
jgi:hypothetical protein